MYKNHLVIVFAIDHYNPLGVIRSLGENGIRPIYIAIRHRVELGVKSKYVSKVYQVDGVEVHAASTQCGEDGRPDGATDAGKGHAQADEEADFLLAPSVDKRWNRKVN